MNDLYDLSGITRQALHKYNTRKEYKLKVTSEVLNHCQKIRKKHKRMGCRRMYQKVSNEIAVGRDIFEQIGFANGYKLKIKRSVIKTTWASKLQVCANHLEGKTLTNINQAWQGDFFYLKVDNVDYYGIAIIDVYSRRLLALHISRRLTSQELIKAFHQAINNRKGIIASNCIFHSDRGTQFLAQDFKTELSKYHFKQSMCKLAQENAYVERVQGTLKYEYLFETSLTSHNLQSQIFKIKDLYNSDRPHSELGYRTPADFEHAINKLSLTDKPQLTIYKWVHPLLTTTNVINKEKRSKKETITNNS